MADIVTKQLQIGDNTYKFKDEEARQQLATKQDTITRVTASVDSNVGTPSVTPTWNNGTLDFAFHNIKGGQGVKGDTVILGNEEEYTLYNTTGNNTDGAMTQDAVTRELDGIGQDIYEYAPTDDEETDLSSSIVISNQGYMITLSGDLYPSSVSDATDFIDIGGYDKIKYSQCHTNSSSADYGIVFYDKNENKLAAVAAIQDSDTSGYTLDTVELPEGTKYVRMTLRKAWESPVLIGLKNVYVKTSKFTGVNNRLDDIEFALENSGTEGSIADLVEANIVDWEEIMYNGKNLIIDGDYFASNVNRNTYYFPIEENVFYRFDVTKANIGLVTIGMTDEEPAVGSAIAETLWQYKPKSKGINFSEYARSNNHTYMFITLQRFSGFSIKIYKGISLIDSIREKKYVLCDTQLLSSSDKQTARGNIGALSADILIDNVVNWDKIASYTPNKLNGISRNSSLIVDGDKFAYQNVRDVFYFLAEKNTPYKFVVANANSSSIKRIGMSDEVPAAGVSVSQILTTANTAAFTSYAVADKEAYMFIALQRDSGTTLDVYKGSTASDAVKNGNFVLTTSQSLTDAEKRQARENIDAASEGGSSIRILYIGNSLTQDSVAYLPLLLNEIAPNVNYQFYDWFNGASTLQEHYERFLNGGVAGNFSISSRDGSWTHRYGDSSNAVTINDVLENYDFDVLVLMEYFNGEGRTDNSAAFSNVVSYIRSHYDKPFKVAAMLHPPMKADSSTYKTTVYNATINVNKKILAETEAMSIIDVGAAMVEAFGTELDVLGKSGHLRYDPVHAQDGLPCLMQAYVHAIWIFRELGLPFGIVNSRLRITQEIHNAVNVPGPHSSSEYPPIEGTDEQVAIAQQCAIKADKIGRKLEIESLDMM